MDVLGTVLRDDISVWGRVSTILAWSISPGSLARIRTLVLLLKLLSHRAVQLHLILVVLTIASVLLLH